MKMRGLLEAHSELEEEFDGDLENIVDAKRELWDAREAFEEIATSTRATSLEGAMFQFCLLKDAAEQVYDGIADAKNQADVRHFMWKIDRLSHSIAGVLRAVVGDLAAKRAFEGEFNSRWDPLVKIERGVAGEPIGDLFMKEFRKAPKPGAA